MTILVDTGLETYPVLIETGSASDVASHIDSGSSGRLIVISDSNVAPLYGRPLVSALAARGRDARMVVFPAGEASKNIKTVVALWDEVFTAPLDRGDTVVAVGGGVAGDIGGFVASTLMRGVDVIQVPTTLLAMADAAIGGKTGFNLPAGKNLVGAFHQPRAVLCWIDALETLDERELRSGMAEVIKSSLIDGPDAVSELGEVMKAALTRDRDALERAVKIGAGLKARIVSEDVKEKGTRALLNLGHTFGHAIEQASGYGAWTHGEAVAIGMIMASEFTCDIDGGSRSTVDLVRQLIVDANLPAGSPDLTIHQWIDPMCRDKKRSRDAIRLILCRAPGQCYTRETSISELEQWFRSRLNLAE